MRYNHLAGSLLVALSLTTFHAKAQSFNYESRVEYPDFGFMAPPGTYTGSVFVLSDDYPEEQPDLDPEVLNIIEHIDFRTDPLTYIMAARDYVFEGNIHGGDVSKDFILQVNDAGRDWFHVPWQHWGPNGREGIHGLTREGPLGAHVLHPDQTRSSSAYAVGFYNGPGGFTIGQVWPSPDEGPDMSRMITSMEHGLAFPEGTVVGKFLFTVLDAPQVPWLTNPLQWQAYLYDCDLTGLDTCPQDMSNAPRSIQTVNLLQMDIMVKDNRADAAGGWVFGTFVYNGDAPTPAYGSFCDHISGGGQNWCNLMPVGVMWGNDPENKESYINARPVKTIINANLNETWINPDPALPAMHLGFNSRLNGPADNPSSSCMSCHSTGQVASISAIMPWLSTDKVAIPKNGEIASDSWMRWFRNFRDGEAFDEGKAISMVFSMQLTKSIESYMEYRGQSQGGNYALNYWSDTATSPITRGTLLPDE